NGFGQEASYSGDTLIGSSFVNISRSGDFSVASLFLGCRAQLHRLVGPRWQMDAEARVLGPVRRGDRGAITAASLGIAWQIAGRWAANVFGSQTRHWLRPAAGSDFGRQDTWRVLYGAELIWFVEDRLTLTAGLTESQSSERGTFAPDDHAYNRT